MAELRLSPPWTTHVHYLEAVFALDDDVKVKYDEDAHEVKLLVTGQDKADSIDRIIRHEVNFGGKVLTVTVVPSNDDSIGAAVRKAFAGNGAVSAIIEGQPQPFMAERTYVLFEPEAIQFFNDDLSSYYGVETTLYQTAAREVFDAGVGVSFCTDIID